MLTADRSTWTATCDKRANCTGATAIVDAKDLDAASDALTALGWYEARRKGGRAKSAWWCPSCAPKGDTGGFGRSAGW